MIQRDIQLTFPHRVHFTRDAFDPANRTLADLFEEGRGEDKDQAILVFLDAGLAKSEAGLADRVAHYFAGFPEGLRLVVDPVVLPGAEVCKNEWPLVERIWMEIHDRALCRHSYVVAIGGGAFLDLVGFAAATAHRGVRLVRMPTTTLSQGDGGVGVKNGVNYFGKKNWVGTFTVPFAVVNDAAFLDSLPVKERRAGIVEGIKVALIRDRIFFEYLEMNADKLADLDPEVLEQVIRRSCELHVDHIATGGDPFEMGSARPLDFGHWVAHKLEQVSGFAIGHGEAVAIGVAVDLIYSARIGMLAGATAERVLRLMERIGFELRSKFLSAADADGKLLILKGLEEFREHLGGELTITLIPEIGRMIEVHRMEVVEIEGALRDLERRSARNKVKIG